MLAIGIPAMRIICLHFLLAGVSIVLSTGRSYPGIRDKNQLGGIRYDYALSLIHISGASADAPVFRNYKYFFLSLCPEQKRRAFQIVPPGKGSGL